MMLLKLVYCANILVAGWISITSLFFPQRALATVFQNAFAYSEAIRLVGALWGAIFHPQHSGVMGSRTNECGLIIPTHLQRFLAPGGCFARTVK